MVLKSFEEYLKDEYATLYNGPDDEMSDSFNIWLENLWADSWIDYGNEYRDYIEMMIHDYKN